MKKISGYLLITILLIALPSQIFCQQKVSVPESGSSDSYVNAVSINPVGLFLKTGVAYLEYERMLWPKLSLAVRLSYFKWFYKEEDGNYYYDEEGNGVGAGVSFRFYFMSSDELKGIYVGASIDVYATKYDWYEYDYGEYYDSGNSFGPAFLGQFGYKFVIGKRFLIDPSIYAGVSYFSNTDNREGINFLFSPALSLGFRF